MSVFWSILLPAGVVTGIFYFLLFRHFLSGWKELPVFKQEKTEPRHRFSIIIPCRNEAPGIATAMKDIVDQEYPASLFEIIVVNDYSTDLTQGVAEEFAAAHPEFSIRVFDLRNTGHQGKKAAITAAVNISYYEWIITSDADCRRGTHWLSVLNAFISRQQPVLVSMPVEMCDHPGTEIPVTDICCDDRQSRWFARAQSLEFMGLITIGAATMQKGHPTMCNGANLCYMKELFYGVGGFADIDDIASGDDELLMHKIHRVRPDAVRFLKSREVIACTHTEPDMQSFLQQRKRWVSKSRHYDRKSITLVLAICYIFNLCILLSFLTGFIIPQAWDLFLLLILLKWIAEYPLLRDAAGFFNREALLKNFFTGSLLHIPYVLFIGIYGNFGTYNWKGRTQR
jgi:cellulose synthase/poly-beta-1,6-N-acetylglucosamine synthase-like glycosyltransferase